MPLTTTQAIYPVCAGHAIALRQPSKTVDLVMPKAAPKICKYDGCNMLVSSGMCHKHKRHEWKGEGQKARIPDWIRPSAIPLTIVCGAPGSGKSTYVASNQGSNDLVIELDGILAELSGKPVHQIDKYPWIGEALDRRNVLLDSLAYESTHDRAWFIVSAPAATDRRRWRELLLPECIVVMETSLDECIRRIDADKTRHCKESDKQHAVKWWNYYIPLDSDLKK